LSCPRVVELLSDWLEGNLDRAPSTRVHAHVTACEGCTSYVDQLQATIRAVLPTPRPSGRECDALVRGFRDWSLRDANPT